MTAVTFVPVRIGLPSKKVRVTALAIASAMLMTPLAFRVVNQVDASVSALRNTPGLLSAETVDVQSSMTKSGLVISGSLAVNAVHAGMTPTHIGNINLYKNVETDTDVAIQTLSAGSTRVLNIMRSPAAASSFTYDVTVPEGGRLALTSDGGVRVVDTSGVSVRSIPKPWAMDANQNPVDAEYSVAGNRLTLEVHHSSANAYPVVSDPWWEDAINGLAVVGGAAAIIIVGASTPLWASAIGTAGVAWGLFEWMRSSVQAANQTSGR